MSDLAVVAASVTPYSDAITKVGTAGEAITAGQTVCLDGSDGYWKLANAIEAPPRTTLYGVALSNAAAGQPLVVQTAGGLNPGVAMTLRRLYILSGSNDGGIAPVADLATGWVACPLGVAVTTTRLQLAIASPHDALAVPVAWMDFRYSQNSGLASLT